MKFSILKHENNEELPNCAGVFLRGGVGGGAETTKMKGSCFPFVLS